MSARNCPPSARCIPACRQIPPDDDGDFGVPDLDGDELWDPLDPDDDEPEPDRNDFWHDPDLDADE
jgi:hypothetical protein